MLSDACPECGTPLFQLKDGETVCPMCNRPIKYMKEGTDSKAVAHRERLEESLRKKVDEVQERLEEADDPVLIGELTDTLMKLMDALDRVKKLGA